jgi:hypothetical protein
MLLTYPTLLISEDNSVNISDNEDGTDSAAEVLGLATYSNSDGLADECAMQYGPGLKRDRAQT